jgi:hypothetical protein
MVFIVQRCLSKPSNAIDDHTETVLNVSTNRICAEHALIYRIGSSNLHVNIVYSRLKLISGVDAEVFQKSELLMNPNS